MYSPLLTAFPNNHPEKLTGQPRLTRVVQPFFDPYRILIDLTFKYRLPYMSGNQEVTAAGGLVSMAADWSQLYERAAFYVDKILKGAKPGDQGSGYAGIQSLANLQNIGRGRACIRHNLAAADLFHSCAPIDGYDGYGVPLMPQSLATAASRSAIATDESCPRKLAGGSRPCTRLCDHG